MKVVVPADFLPSAQVEVTKQDSSEKKLPSKYLPSYKWLQIVLPQTKYTIQLPSIHLKERRDNKLISLLVRLWKSHENYLNVLKVHGFDY